MNAISIDTRSIEERKAVFDHFEPDEIEQNFDSMTEAWDAGRGNGFEDGQEYGYEEGATDGEQRARVDLWAEIKGMAETLTIAQVIEQLECKDPELRDVEPAVVT